MSNGTQKQYKQFSINDESEACVVLGSLISGVIINLAKYSEYANEAIELLENLDEEKVPAKDYDGINDKLLYRQHEILKLISDHQKSSFSYIEVRKIFKEKNFLSKELDENANLLLKEFLDIRNWTFHNPQSMLSAGKEVAEKNIPEEFKGVIKITPQLNPIIIREIEYYDVNMLVSLIRHTQKRIVQFNQVLSCMKEDYQAIFDRIQGRPLLLLNGSDPFKIQYIKHKCVSRLGDYGNDVSQISMAIQKSKYDGSKKTYDDFVFRLNKIDEVPDDKK